MIRTLNPFDEPSLSSRTHRREFAGVAESHRNIELAQDARFVLAAGSVGAKASVLLSVSPVRDYPM
jgi:hypothetical protein